MSLSELEYFLTSLPPNLQVEFLKQVKGLEALCSASPTLANLCANQPDLEWKIEVADLLKINAKTLTLDSLNQNYDLDADSFFQAFKQLQASELAALLNNPKSYSTDYDESIIEPNPTPFSRLSPVSRDWLIQIHNRAFQDWETSPSIDTAEVALRGLDPTGILFEINFDYAEPPDEEALNFSDENDSDYDIEVDDQVLLKWFGNPSDRHLQSLLNDSNPASIDRLHFAVNLQDTICSLFEDTKLYCT